MGIHLTGSQILSAFARAPWAWSLEMPAISAALDQFSLLAMILHRPGVDVELDDEINREFVRLDRDTGPALLFMAMVEPENAGREIHERKYFQAITAAVAYAHYAGDEWRNRNLAAPFVAVQLGIPLEMLPCIVVVAKRAVTQAPSSISWVKTCPQRVGEQLVRIGEIAANYQYAPFAIPDTEAVAQDVDMCGGHGSGIPLRAALRSVANAFDLGHPFGSDPYMGPTGAAWRRNPSELLTWVRRHVQQQQSIRLQEDRRAAIADQEFGMATGADVADDDYWRFLEGVALATALPPQSMGLLANHKNLEPSTVTCLHTAETLVSYEHLLGNIDWSVALLAAAKALELEINWSATQAARRTAGIIMPTFYSKYAKGFMARVDTGDGNFIDLNRCLHGNWHPPTLGELRHLYAKGPEVGFEAARDLASELAKVVQYRNAGAHGAILGLVDAQKVTQHVRSLFASDLGLTLSAAKTGTRGY